MVYFWSFLPHFAHLLVSLSQQKRQTLVVCFFVEQERDRPQGRLSVFALKTLIKSFLNERHPLHQKKTQDWIKF